MRMRSDNDILPGAVRYAVERRGLRPKPQLELKTVARLLNRHTAVKSPEACLVVAVIALAIGDCRSNSPARRGEARGFIEGPRLEMWASLVGLEPDFVREVARKAGYLAEPNRATPQAKREAAPRKEPAHA